MESETKNQKRVNKGFQKIDRVLWSSAKEKKLDGVLNKHRVLKCWQETVSAFLVEADKLSQAVDFKQGLLVVACLSKELAAKIYLFSQQIINAINELLGHKLVYAIHVEY